MQKPGFLTNSISALQSGFKENIIFYSVLLASVALHLIALFNISFIITSPPQNKPKANIEITLVREQTPEAPEIADYLAQANKVGGGEAKEKTPNPSPEPKTEEIKTEEEPTKAEQKPEQTQQVAKAPLTSPAPITKEEANPTPPPPTPQVNAAPLAPIVAKQAEEKIVVEPDMPDIIADAVITPAQPADMIKPDATAKPTPTAASLVANSLEVARLESEVQKILTTLSKEQPRKLPINSVSAQKYEAAAYLEGWRKKIERVGTLNYPQVAKRQGISGKLMLSVDINPDGSVADIVISRSSGHKLLDDAAVKIVNLAAPYAPIPAEVLGDYDMLTIIRTWNFDTSGTLKAR